MTMDSPAVFLGPWVGGLEADRARIGVRVQEDSAWQVRVYPEGSSQMGWLSEPQKPRIDRGSVLVFPLLGLRPDTAYRYEIRTASTGQVVAQGTFRTAPPLGAPRPFAFAMAGTYLPQIASKNAVPPEALVPSSGDQAFLLLLGNPVVADAFQANGLGKIPLTLEDYRGLYQQAWSQPGWREVFRSTPVFAVWGHRAVDWGWVWANVDRTEARLPRGVSWYRRLRRWPEETWNLSRRRVVAAMQAYWEHLGQFSPPLLMPPEGVEDLGRPLVLPADRGHFGYTFTFGAAAFFVLDVHTHRVRGPLGRRWLHPEQWRALEGWLASVKEAYPLKFLVTPASVFARGPGDCWAQDKNALRRLLHVIAARQVQGVVFLSQGLEQGWVVEAVLTGDGGRSVVVWEIGLGAMTPGHRPPGTWLPTRWVRVPLVRQMRVRIPPLKGPQVAHVQVTWEPRPEIHLRFHDGARVLAQTRMTIPRK